MSIPRLLPLLLVAAGSTAASCHAQTVDPAKLKDKVSIRVGQTLALQFDRKGDALSNPKIVKAVVENPPTLSLEFRDKGKMLWLAAKNPYSKSLRYRALARHKGRKSYFETSIAPVMAGLLGMEVWQEPIEELVLFDFKLIGEMP
jgi:hypothetical protein